MSHQAAKILVDAILKHSAEQNQALLDIEKLCTPEEFDRYRLMIGQSMGQMLLEVINPIVAMYPDLKPPWMT